LDFLKKDPLFRDEGARAQVEIPSKRVSMKRLDHTQTNVKGQESDAEVALKEAHSRFKRSVLDKCLNFFNKTLCIHTSFFNFLFAPQRRGGRAQVEIPSKRVSMKRLDHTQTNVKDQESDAEVALKEAHSRFKRSVLDKCLNFFNKTLCIHTSFFN
jgi:hypothetical protein